MSAVSRPSLRGLFVAVALLALLATASAAQAAPKFKAPAAKGGIYLAIGDSLAFGYQQSKVIAGLPNPNPNTFNTGYVDVFKLGSPLTGSTGFNATYPGVSTVNLGCPGETSTTLLTATNATTGCTTYPFSIHVNHPGQTQMQKALSVLSANPGKVVPVTINIGANDVLGLVGTCTTAGVISLSCVQAGAPATFATVQQNLDTAVGQIRGLGPQSNGGEIIVIGLYNPLYPAIFQQTLAQTGSQALAAQAAAGTDALANQLNALQATVADKYKAYFVDPMPLFNPSSGANPPLEISTICTLTAVCGPLQDIHPTDLGYAKFGDLVKQVSQY
jgi:lysophospholipase L1-like esterase